MNRVGRQEVPNGRCDFPEGIPPDGRPDRRIAQIAQELVDRFAHDSSTLRHQSSAILPLIFQALGLSPLTPHLLPNHNRRGNTLSVSQTRAAAGDNPSLAQSMMYYYYAGEIWATRKRAAALRRRGRPTGLLPNRRFSSSKRREAGCSGSVRKNLGTYQIEF